MTDSIDTLKVKIIGQVALIDSANELKKIEQFIHRNTPGYNLLDQPIIMEPEPQSGFSSILDELERIELVNNSR